MEQYISKTDVVAQIKRRLMLLVPKMTFQQQRAELEKLLCLLDTLEVKEVDLEKEIETHLKDCLDVKFPTTDIELIKKDVTYTAKKFFELGLSVNSPITAADRGTAEEIIINLKRVEQDYRIDLTREMEWVKNKVKKGE